MSVADQTPVAGYTGNGVATAFSFPFAVLAEGDVSVMVAGLLLTLNVHYTVSGVGGASGTVTFTSAPASLASIVIYRDSELTRATDYQDNGDLLAATLNRDLDRLWLALQEVLAGGKVSPRSVRAPIGETLSDLPPAAARAGRLLSFNAVTGDVDTVAPVEGTATALAIQLASTASGKGAALIGVEDAGAYWASATQEGIGQELGANSVFLARSGESLADVSARITSGVIDLRAGTYSAADVQLLGQSLRGRGITATTLLASGTSEVLRLGYVNSPSQWTWRSVDDVTVSGNLKASDGLVFKAPTNTELSGRWELNRITALGCNRGIYKPSGNIGNTYRNVNLRSCDYGFYSVGQTSPLMHGGCDHFIGGEASNNALAAFYIDSAQSGTGQTRWTNTVIEGNPGFGIFVKNYASSFTPLLLDGVWFEGNATAGSVALNGTAYTPKDLYLENCAHAIMRNGIVGKTQLVNSRLTVDGCNLNADTTTWAIDASSTVVVRGAQLDGGAHPVCVESVSSSSRVIGNFSARIRSPHRTPSTSSNGVKLLAQPYNSAGPWSFTGTSTINATSVVDGRSYASCAELSLVGARTQLDNATNSTLTINKWYVASMDLKHVSGVIGNTIITLANSIAVFSNWASIAETGKWQTAATIGRCSSGGTVRLQLQNTGAGTEVWRFGALQIMEFDDEQAMLDYYNSGVTRSA